MGKQVSGRCSTILFIDVYKRQSELCDIDDIAKAYHEFSPEASWNGSNYTNATSGVKADNTFFCLLYTSGVKAQGFVGTPQRG